MSKQKNGGKEVLWPLKSTFIWLSGILIMAAGHWSGAATFGPLTDYQISFVISFPIGLSYKIYDARNDCINMLSYVSSLVFNDAIVLNLSFYNTGQRFYLSLDFLKVDVWFCSRSKKHILIPTLKDSHRKKLLECRESNLVSNMADHLMFSVTELTDARPMGQWASWPVARWAA